MLWFLRFYLFWKEGELEWLVHSILGALLEDLFTIWWKKRLDPIFGLCMMCDVIVFQILLILEGGWAGMARPQHLKGFLGGFICNVKKKMFWPHFWSLQNVRCYYLSDFTNFGWKVSWNGLSTASQGLSWRIYLRYDGRNVLTPFLDFAWCVMLLFLRFYFFWKEGQL